MKIQLFIKYLFDKLSALVGLIILSPVFFIVSLILKLQGEDVFFKQKRLGQFGEEFFAIKFTTMPKGSEKLGLITTTNDSRPTKLGKFLRKTKINEFPQLINVLKGDMSIVGPRPLIKSHILKIASEEQIIDYYQRRPGLTGYANLKYHHEDRLLAEANNPQEYYKDVIFPDKLSLEIQYHKDWNLWVDSKVLIKTIITLINDMIK